MKYSRYLVLLIIIVIFCSTTFFLIYGEVKKQTVADLNNRQLVHARQAVKGIQDHFRHATDVLRILSLQDHIIQLDESGKKMMSDVQRIHSSEIMSVTRMDARGRIVHVVPDNAASGGANISGQEHVREVMKTHALVISDVFWAVQGYRSVAIHMPVFRNGVYNGTIAFLISFDEVAKKYLEDIRIGKDGYAWVLSRKGIELYDPVQGITGKSIFEVGKDFPDLIVMAREMLEGREGITTYHFNRVRGSDANTVIKHAVYMPIRIDNTFWSIAVATPESEVTTLMEGFKGKLFLMILILFISCAVLAVFFFRAQVIIREQKKRRSIEEALRLSEKKYHDIFDNAIMGIYQSTPAGRYQSANPALAQIFGYKTPEEMIADIQDIQSEVYVHPDDRLRISKLFAEEGTVKGFHVEYKRKDGSRFWISLHGKAIRDAAGKILHYEGTIEDITQQKRAEEELTRYREHLEELVKERTIELEIARVKAESADRLKSAFLATMSHELRTPLNSIIGFTGILLQRMVGPLNDEQNKQLNMVNNSAKHLLDLINDVLDISKIEAGQFNVFNETFDLGASVAKVVQSSRPLADKKGLKLSVMVDTAIGLISSDRRRVEQILLNLISNAVKFTEKGSIDVECISAGNKIVLSVRDTGIGIKEEDMGKLFNAFQQIESGITRRYDGTGLGLSISKKLTEMLGGKIMVTSVWGKGSTFSFVLPKEGENT